MPKPEQDLQTAWTRAMRARGWVFHKTHGNQFMKGWPDLYAFHREHGHRWVELKTPTGRLTKAQVRVFERWTFEGIPIWVVTSADQLDLVHQPPNVSTWLEKRTRRLREALRRFSRRLSEDPGVS